MLKCRVEISGLAEKDIDRIAEHHLKTVGPNSAERITDKLLDSIENLAEFPMLGAEHPDPALKRRGYRKLICGEYVSIYRIIDETVYIYRVVYGATNYTKLLK